jgi:hypothetical protein
MSTLTRRAVLAFAALFAACGGLFSISVDDFLTLSQRLTGRQGLDRQLAATYLNALVATPANQRMLADFMGFGGMSPEHTALENTIIEWWYTGTYVTGGETKLATHSGALMWSAIGTPAAGTCGGVFGAWAQPRRPA